MLLLTTKAAMSVQKSSLSTQEPTSPLGFPLTTSKHRIACLFAPYSKTTFMICKMALMALAASAIYISIGGIGAHATFLSKLGIPEKGAMVLTVCAEIALAVYNLYLAIHWGREEHIAQRKERSLVDAFGGQKAFDALPKVLLSTFTEDQKSPAIAKSHRIVVGMAKEGRLFFFNVKNKRSQRLEIFSLAYTLPNQPQKRKIATPSLNPSQSKTASSRPQRRIHTLSQSSQSNNFEQQFVDQMVQVTKSMGAVIETSVKILTEIDDPDGEKKHSKLVSEIRSLLNGNHGAYQLIETPTTSKQFNAQTMHTSEREKALGLKPKAFQ